MSLPPALRSVAAAGILVGSGCSSGAPAGSPSATATGSGGGAVATASNAGTGGGEGALGGAGPDGGGDGGATEGGPAFLDGFFPIAADYQMHDSFATWKQRGVNTMIRVPPQDSVKAWTDEANKLGLRMIRKPKNDPHDDVGETNLLAWHWNDEPELHGLPASDLAAFQKEMHAVDPSRPIHVNFWGGGMLENPDGCYGSACYQDFVDHADWVSDDIYPCNKYACDIGLVGQTLDGLTKWIGAKQAAFAYIESSDFDGNGTGPSPRRLRAEVWDAVIHGARGVFYFAVRLNPGDAPGVADYDATPNDVADAMGPLHATLTALAPVLQRAVDPKGVSIDVGGDLEAGWREAQDGTRYFLVLNRSDQKLDAAKLHLHDEAAAGPVTVVGESRTVELGEKGLVVDDFDAYETHVYEVH